MRRADLRPFVLVAVLVTLLAAARSVEPESGKAGSFVREIGGGLTLGLMIVCASRGAAGAQRVVSVSRVTGECLSLAKGCGLTALLAAPSLVAGWELGGTRLEFLSVATGLIAASMLGAALGFSLAMFAVPLPVATLLAASLTAVTLWPASLGWFAAIGSRFPAPESPTAIVLALVALVLASGVALTARARRVG